MSWIQDLYDTYNNCQPMIGYSGEAGERPLLPICHSTSQVQIEITIDGKGNFLRARVITDKAKDATTIIPCTEGSASRAGSKPECHPLCDKLQYVAGDFVKHGGSVTSGFANNPLEPHTTYLETLNKWCQSKFAHPKAEAVLKYVKKAVVIDDLVKSNILFVDNVNQFLAKNEVNREKDAKDIFTVTNSQESAFVRWVIETPGALETKVWRDMTLYESWINYYLSTKKKEQFCFVTGEEAILTANHPKYIRREGDGAKIISSNDISGFTYRGRFLTATQACNVSLEVSHKAHNALSWLISRQGYTNGNQAIVAWATSGAPIPKPLEDSFSLLGLDHLAPDSHELTPTAQHVALQLKHRIAGYGQSLADTTGVIVMGLDSATPGRLSITYYRKLKGSEFLERIESWHTTCTWHHTYRTIIQIDENTSIQKRKVIPFVGAPSPKDIAEAAYGLRVDDKLVASTINRILPCIIDGFPIPRDLVESTMRRACNRSGMQEWDWNKTLSIACALYKKFKQKENYSMTLDEKRSTRDYLYGRLLALAESLEEWALNTAHENRETNAARMMQRFAEHPFSTWRTIELSLAPYKAKLGGKATKRLHTIDGVIASFSSGDFINDKRLTGEFLLGYHCQRDELRNKVEANVETNEK